MPPWALVTAVVDERFPFFNLIRDMPLFLLARRHSVLDDNDPAVDQADFGFSGLGQHGPSSVFGFVSLDEWCELGEGYFNAVEVRFSPVLRGSDQD